MPYEAAKAIAATFCWKIRYALTPVFGTDFPNLCLRPNSEKFGNMLIDPAIIEHCTAQARKYRDQESSVLSQSPIDMSRPPTPDTPTHPRRDRRGGEKIIRAPISTYTSPYSSDAGTDDSYTTASMSPEPMYRNMWTPANTPRSVPHPERRLPSPRDIVSELRRKAEARVNLELSPPMSSSANISPQVSPKTVFLRIGADEGYEGDQDDVNDESQYLGANNTVDKCLSEEEKAARILMDLKHPNIYTSRQDKTASDRWCDKGRLRKRAASA